MVQRCDYWERVVMMWTPYPEIVYGNFRTNGTGWLDIWLHKLDTVKESQALWISSSSEEEARRSTVRILDLGAGMGEQVSDSFVNRA